MSEHHDVREAVAVARNTERMVMEIAKALRIDDALIYPYREPPQYLMNVPPTPRLLEELAAKLRPPETLRPRPSRES
jgi:hypothetical protein